MNDWCDPCKHGDHAACTGIYPFMDSFMYCRCYCHDRGTGKTTRLIEEAVSLVAELPEGSFVFVTGAHSKWLLQLSHDFKASGLSDVIFLTPQQILNGALRGRRGVLLIDDFSDLPMREMIILKEEANILRRQ